MEAEHGPLFHRGRTGAAAGAWAGAEEASKSGAAQGTRTRPQRSTRESAASFKQPQLEGRTDRTADAGKATKSRKAKPSK